MYLEVCYESVHFNDYSLYSFVVSKTNSDLSRI